MSNSYDNDGVGTSASTSTVEKVHEKTREEFQSGEVAWELSQGTNGEGWGQTLDPNDRDPDNHPHFMDKRLDKTDVTEVYRVTFIWEEGYYEAFYFDPESDVNMSKVPTLPPDTAWYIRGMNAVIFNGKNITEDVDVYAGRRILFAGEDGTVYNTLTYSPELQPVNLDT